MTDEQRVLLRGMAGSSSQPSPASGAGTSVLVGGRGAGQREIARRYGVDADTIRRWRSRFTETGVKGVGVIAKGRGRKSSLPPGTVAEVLRLTQQDRPDGPWLDGWVSARTQCQALDGTQPSLPMKPGRAGTMTHDYKRQGTIDLFAAMKIGKTVPRGLGVHVVLDNLAAHSAPEIMA
jgi:hypothetical protein